MSHGNTLAGLGIVLIALGLFKGDWFLLAAWLGGNFLLLGIAHLRGWHRIFGKRDDGTLPLWSRAAFLPLLLLTSAVWRLLRLGREPAQSVVSDRLVMGRRLLPSEVDRPFENFVDLTAEFSEPAAIRRLPGYRAFPILDGSAPSPEALRAAVESLRPGPTFVHCAQGHGRTGLFALALLLQEGVARDVEDGLRILRTARPAIRLSKVQKQCIVGYRI